MKPYRRIKFRKFLAGKVESFAYQLSSWAFRLRDWADKIAPPELWTVLLVLLLAVMSTPAHADSLSIAVVDTQGNTKTQSVNVDAECAIKSDDGSTVQELKTGLLYGETDSKRTAESWYGNIKDSHRIVSGAKRMLSHSTSTKDKYEDDTATSASEQSAGGTAPYWFNLTGVEADEFAGYDLRLSFHMGLGLEYVSESARHSFKIEAGPGMVYEEQRDDTGSKSDTGHISGRGWQEYIWHASDTIELSEQIEYLYDYDDQDNYRVNAEAGLTGKINSWLSFKLGPKVRYVNKPPEGKKRTDIISTATIIFTFR